MGIRDRLSQAQDKVRDADDEGLTEKQVRNEARKRRRRLGIALFAAGPLAGWPGR